MYWLLAISALLGLYLWWSVTRWDQVIRYTPAHPERGTVMRFPEGVAPGWYEVIESRQRGSEYAPLFGPPRFDIFLKRLGKKDELMWEIMES